VQGCDLTQAPKPKQAPDPESILVFKSEADRLAIQHRKKEYIEFEWAGESWRIPMGNFGGVSVLPSNEGRAISVFAALQSSTDTTDRKIRFSAPGVLAEDRKLIALIMRDTQSGKPPRVSVADRVRGGDSVGGDQLVWRSFPESSAQLGATADETELMFSVIWVPAVTDALGDEVLWKCKNTNRHTVQEYFDGFSYSLNWRFQDVCELRTWVTPTLTATVAVPSGVMNRPDEVSQAALDFLASLLTKKE
jgi:hypothetical protein